MQVIQRIDVFSTGKISAFIALFFGFIIGIIKTMLANILPVVPTTTTATSTTTSGWTLIILLPIAYALEYFIIGMLFALAYNLLVKLFGGIKVEIEEVVEYKIKEVSKPLNIKTKPLKTQKA